MIEDLQRWVSRGPNRAWRLEYGDGIAECVVLELWAKDGRHKTFPLEGEGSYLLLASQSLREFTPEDYENRPSFAEVLKEVQEAFAEADAKREQDIENHPDNGKEGWWIVDGIRHDAKVKASSAAEAIRKAAEADAVQSWELPTAEFWCEELPDVFR